MSSDFKFRSDMDPTITVTMAGETVDRLKKSIQVIESAVRTEMKKQVLLKTCEAGEGLLAQGRLKCPR
jgi:hypothetical protein